METQQAVTGKAAPVVHQPTVPAVVANDAWGSEGVDSTDIIIPKILLMQGLSKLVANELAKAGEFRESLNSQLLGGKEKPLEFIAFHTFKNWIIFEEKNGKQEYVRQEPMTPMNQDWKLEEVVGGVKVRRDKSLNYYVLLPSEVASGTYFPYLISFRRTSYHAGRKLSTTFAKLKMFNAPPASRVFSLMSRLEKNDRGAFYVFDVAESRVTTEAEIKAAYDWYQVVRKANVKIDDSDLTATDDSAEFTQDPDDFQV